MIRWEMFWKNGMEYLGPNFKLEFDAGDMTRWEVASATLRVSVSRAGEE